MRLAILLFVFLISPILNAQTLIIGTLSNDPPFEIRADEAGNVFGFDIAIMTEVCKRLQATCQFKLLPFTEIFAEVMSGKIQLGIAAINISDERKERFLFSIPYLASAAQFVSLNTSGITTLDQIQGKKIGILKGSLYRVGILEQNPAFKRVYEYDGTPEVFEALANGNVDAVITDKDIAQYWVANNSGLFRLVGEKIPMGDGYGIIANIGNDALIKNVNKALSAMEIDGSYLKIYNRYFGPVPKL